MKLPQYINIEAIFNIYRSFVLAISIARNTSGIVETKPSNMSQSATRSRVVQLYKQLIYLGREYPKNPEVMTAKIHDVFKRNASESDPKKIEDLIDKGNYIVKELEALYYLRKYRTLKKRYYETEESQASTPYLSQAIKDEQISK